MLDNYFDILLTTPIQIEGFKMLDFVLDVGAVIAIATIWLNLSKEWKNSRRVIAISDLDSDTIEEYGCIPLQVAGSKIRLVDFAARVRSFCLHGPRTRKYAFLAEKVRVMRAGKELNYTKGKSKDKLRITLADCESLKRSPSPSKRAVMPRLLFAMCNQPTCEKKHIVSMCARGAFLTFMTKQARANTT